MNSTFSGHEHLRPLASFLESVQRWAAARPDIAAVLLVGSWARGEAGSGSDVDLVILTEAPGRLLAEQGWLDDMGAVISVHEEDWGRVQSLRVIYAPGLEVEYGLTDRKWVAQPLDPGTAAVLSGGFTMVFQRDDGLSTALDALISSDMAQESLSGAEAERAGDTSHSDGPVRSLAIGGSGLCLAITLGIWSGVAHDQSLWPLPGVYFVELVSLALVCAALWIANHRLAEVSVWIMLGVLAGFSWMARLSVGALYAPVALVFGAACLVLVVRTPGRLIGWLGISLLAALVEVGMILVLATP
ncbi:MAG: nucleotidyltransferase domain-containing protein [Anaerolineales bacterium]|jgi:predicted nucleotidyltransferase